MIAFREGKTEAGSALYEKAIELARAKKLVALGQLAAVHYFAEFANLGNYISAEEAQQISTLMEDKRVIEEIRDIYSARLKPTLLSHTLQQESKTSIKAIIPGIVGD
jgi:hypothetical protein